MPVTTLLRLPRAVLRFAVDKVGSSKPTERLSCDRAKLSRYLSGDGIELGALNSPLDLSGNTRVARVRYGDRWDKAEVLHHFPELQSDSSTIVETDVKCDFICRRLKMLLKDDLTLSRRI
jgi:hypothetical protein